jgi:hypothetical protein
MLQKRRRGIRKKAGKDRTNKIQRRDTEIKKKVRLS